MIRKLIPILLALVGLGIGIGAGLFLRPAAEATNETAHGAEGAATEGDASKAEDDAAHADTAPKEGEAAAAEDAENGPEYVKLSNQFVIPVLEQGQVASMVILALTLEVAHGSSETTYTREPKLRDAFLQVLFDHANSGGFKGAFTDGSNLVLLRKALLEAAQTAIGPTVTDVLISDIARQDS
jgi:flagellar protein FliL